MVKKIIIVIMIILFLNISLTGCIDNNEIASLSLDKIPPIILFSKEGKSLMVLTAGIGLNWSNVSIRSGNCILPTGNITAGDRITDCEGLLILIWIPSNTIIGKWKF